jgi:hypothetical protein
MKKMKVMVLVLLAFGMQAMAQNTTEERAKKMTERLSAEVDLTEEQKVVITQLNADFVLQMKELKKSEKVEPGTYRTMRKSHKEQIAAQLSEGQKQILKEKKKAHRDIRKKMEKEIRAYRKANILPVLIEKRASFEEKLSEDEKKTIEALRVKIGDKRKTWKAMTPEQKREHRKVLEGDFKEKRKEERKEMKAQLKPILETHEAELKSIEQQIAPLRKVWETDMKVIRDKYMNTDSVSMKHNHKKHGKPGKHGKKQGLHKKEGAMKARFLLMDPAKAIEEEVGDE